MDSGDSAATSDWRAWAWRVSLVLLLVVAFFVVNTTRSLLFGVQSKGQWAQTQELLRAYGEEELGDPNALHHISDELWERPWGARQDIRRWHLVLDLLIFGTVALVLLVRMVVNRDRKRRMNVLAVPDEI